ncbi:glycoside hydrolase family 16 protein [Streptomyces sp. CA2R106]|uniref:glycoside hydrolase family 16 protein n=1 Tax=Streptomyces sp. CA2R106 TaxID=3120153 RepID=UPI003009DA7B
MERTDRQSRTGRWRRGRGARLAVSAVVAVLVAVAGPAQGGPRAAAAAPSDDGVSAAERYGWGTPLPDGTDEFDYGSPSQPAPPDPAKWETAGDSDGCWPGNGGHGQRCPQNARVVGGVLEEVGDGDGTTGWLASRFGQQYGRWEARVRSYPTGAEAAWTYHPLLILWPDSESWPQDGEYDYLEDEVPGGDCAQANIHYPQDAGVPTQQESAQKCGVDMTQWHDVAVEWTPDHVTGYLDGAEWYSFSGGADDVRRCIQCAGSLHQTLQLDAVRDNDTDPVQSAVYEVDWARVYALS